MLLLAAVVFGATAWFAGVRPGGYAGAISLAALVMAQVVPGTALAVYGLHVFYLGGLVWAGPRVSRLVRGAAPSPNSPGGRVGTWLKRGRALGQALWKSRR